MTDHLDGIAVGVFTFFFLLVTILGFAAARWRRAADMASLDEWGLGGRGFGTFIAWFLIGGDLYTAYTFIAVPATLYAGSAMGSSPCPTRSSSTRSSSCSSRGCGRSRTGTASSHRRTSWRAATTAVRSHSPSP